MTLHNLHPHIPCVHVLHYSDGPSKPVSIAEALSMLSGFGNECRSLLETGYGRNPHCAFRFDAALYWRGVIGERVPFLRMVA